MDRLPIQIAIREQPRATSNCRPTTLPSAFLMILEWFPVYGHLIPFRRGVNVLGLSREQPHFFWIVEIFGLANVEVTTMTEEGRERRRDGQPHTL